VTPSRLAAVLIVRDEAARLPGCLRSLAGVVDEIVVHDTGSVDGTVAIARAAGAAVHEGHWDDDFARARNVGLDLATAPWVLVLDADERVGAGPDPAALRDLLAATTADVLTVDVRNAYPEELGGDYRHPGPRLLRRDTVRYRGRVHEQPVSSRGDAVAACPRAVLRLDHTGYADAGVVRAKARRNAAIAAAELATLRATGAAPGPAVAKVLLDLGRSLVLCDRRQQAAEVLGELRAGFPGTRRAVEATDALARLLLAGGRDGAVLALAGELRAAGVDGRYCDWLRAQALAQLGGVQEALELLRGVDVLRDSAGRELDVAQVLEVRALVATLAGSPDEAVTCLADAMLAGRRRGRGALLLDLCAGRTPDAVTALLLDRERLAGAGAGAGDARLALAAELAACREPGPAIAAGLVAANAVPVGPGCR